MNDSKLLKKLGITPGAPVVLITAEESFSNLLDAIDEYCPHLRIEKMSREDILFLLDSYADCVVNYHPENHHQERATLLRNFKMLKRYGLSDEDYESLDFC